MEPSVSSKINLDPETFERCDFQPRHEGPTVLPHDLIFHDLYSLAATQNTVVIRDMNTGHSASHQQFLCDIVAFRKRLMEELHPQTLQALRDEREVSLLILSGGYEFTVALFATFSLGGIAVPLSEFVILYQPPDLLTRLVSDICFHAGPHITVEEAVHHCNTVRAHAILTSIKHLSIANAVGSRSRIGKEKFRSIISSSSLLTSNLDITSISFCSGRVLDQNKPSLVIFTSGSTGLPKAVAIRRYNVYAGVRILLQAQNVDSKTTVAQFLPTHHAAGLLFNTLPVILGGGCVEFNQQGFEPSKVWQRFRDGGMPMFSAVPTVYVRLISYWESVISKLPAEERDSYRSAVSGIGNFHCGAAALPRHVSEKWFDLTGKSIIERYGGSEMGNVYTNLPGEAAVPVCCALPVICRISV